MRPDDPIALDIVRRAMVARIATLSRNGRPHINPLYFIDLEGRLYLGTSDRTLAALNVKSNPETTVLLNVEREPASRTVLRLRGHAAVRIDPELERRYLRRSVRKYFVNWPGLKNAVVNARLFPVMHRYHASGWRGTACVIEFIPRAAELLDVPESPERVEP